MAVSAEEKDYVHILNRMIEGKESITVEYIVLNIADFELSPDTFVLDNLAELREWRPDVLILRICENTQEEKVEAFGAAYLKLIRYFHQDELKIYAVGTFWKHEAKEACICKSRGTAGGNLCFTGIFTFDSVSSDRTV